MRRRTVLFSGAVFCAALTVGAQQAEDSYARHLREGAAEISQGNFSAAMADIQAAMALRPNDAAGWYEFGSLLGQSGDFPGAESAFRHALVLQPDLAKAHYGLALALIGDPHNKEDWNGAVAECREAVELQPDYAEALNLLGAGLIKLGQPDAAMQALQRAIHLSPALAQAHFNLGMVLESKNQLADAQKEYRAAITAKGTYPEVSSALGSLLFRTGDSAGAEQELKTALHANPDLGSAHYTRARMLQSQHRKPEAAVEFAIQKEISEGQVNAVQSSAMSNQGLELAKKGDLMGAVTALRAAIALKPDYGVPHFNLGLILADQGKTAEARQELTKAISLLPGQAAPWFELGRLLSFSGNQHGALEMTAWAAHLAPSNTAVQSELARLRAVSQGAESLVQPKAGAAADTATAHLAFAQELREQGDNQGAIGELLRALTLEPANQDARRELAAAYASSGQKDRAILEYQKLLLAFPNNAAGQAALGKMLAR